MRNYDAMRPHLEQLRSALARERELTGLERDRAEGLAVNLAPAVRDMAAILADLAPLLSNLQMGDAPGHAHVEMTSNTVHVPTGYRALETQVQRARESQARARIRARMRARARATIFSPDGKLTNRQRRIRYYI